MQTRLSTGLRAQTMLPSAPEYVANFALEYDWDMYDTDANR